MSVLSLLGPIVVTGAGSGIGRALVLDLIARGATLVVAADRSIEAARETASLAGPAVRPYRLDVSDGAAVNATVRELIRDHGLISGWFSNAGVNTSDGLGTEEDWRRALDVNVLAHVHAAREVLPGMEDRGHGAFIITASAAGLMMDLRTAVYTASKHAAVGFAEWLAAGVADGVSVHCVCPEGVQTGMTRPDSISAAGTISFLSAEVVARSIVDGVDKGDFLILTHPNTAEFERRRVDDRPRWLAGMRRARRAVLHLDRLFPLQGH